MHLNVGSSNHQRLLEIKLNAERYSISPWKYSYANGKRHVIAKYQSACLAFDIELDLQSTFVGENGLRKKHVQIKYNSCLYKNRKASSDFITSGKRLHPSFNVRFFDQALGQANEEIRCVEQKKKHEHKQ